MIRFTGIRAVAFVCLALVIPALRAQHRVDPGNMYERVMAVVPWTGSGTHADPRRPMYVPGPTQMNPASRSGILGFQCVESDDNKYALCEFVAATPAALKPILTDPNVKAFLKGRDKRDDAITEFKKYKKDFDPTHFGVIVQ